MTRARAEGHHPDARTGGNLNVAFSCRPSTGLGLGPNKDSIHIVISINWYLSAVSWEFIRPARLCKSLDCQLFKKLQNRVLGSELQQHKGKLYNIKQPKRADRFRVLLTYYWYW